MEDVTASYFPRHGDLQVAVSPEAVDEQLQEDEAVAAAMQEAERLIAEKAQFCLEVCEEHGQQIEKVPHHWLVCAVAQALLNSRKCRSLHSEKYLVEAAREILFPGGDLEHECGSEELGKLVNLFMPEKQDERQESNDSTTTA